MDRIEIAFSYYGLLEQFKTPQNSIKIGGIMEKPKKKAGRPKVYNEKFKKGDFTKKLRSDTDQCTCFGWQPVNNRCKKSKDYGLNIMRCVALIPLHVCKPDYCPFYKTHDQQAAQLVEVKERLLTLPERDQFIINSVYYRKNYYREGLKEL